MDDMQAFDKQLASVILERVGPSEPVDDAAIFTTITAQSHKWRFPSMFSAAKFVVAGAIVALFGGFLLAGILTTQQGDEALPAAVTESPSPTTTEELLAGMVTEEVEPGVLRVVNDGVRDLVYRVGGYPGAMVDVTPDGGVWLSGDEGRHGLFRLGEEPVFEDLGGWPPYREVAPDGSLWATDWISDGGGDDIGSGIVSFDGVAWTSRATTTDWLGSLALGPDGTVWVAALDQNKHCPDIEPGDCPGPVLMRLEDDGSLTTFDHADVYDGEIGEVVVSPDGDVWTPGGYQEAEVLLRFDGEEWEVIPGPEGVVNTAEGRSLAFGPDGTLWVHANDPSGSDWNSGGLARFDDPGWTVLGEADGVEPWGAQGWIATDLISVAADGSFWLNGIDHLGGCDGVDHYDGSTWTSYLRGSCVHDLSIAPDGGVWVRADIVDVPGNATGLYVITPEAVAASDAEVSEPPSVEEPPDSEEATTTTEELLSGMVTEEVEPGVLRVVNDGVRYITSPESDFQSSGVALAPDGGVWLSGQRTMYRLGHEATFQVPDDIWWPYRDVGPDGSLWAIALDHVQSFDGQTWSKRTGPTGDDLLLGSLAIGPDGTIWVAASDRDRYCPNTDSADCSGTVLLRVEDDGTMTTMDGWADGYEGDVAFDELAVSPDGDVWLIGMERWDGPEAEALLRFDGSEWEVIPGPERFLNHLFGNSLDIGPDGALWVNASNGYSGGQGVGGLARFDDEGWTTFSEADGVQDWGGEGFIATDLLTVAPDGSLWMNGAHDENGCGGVAHYDGTTWSSYLRYSCVHDLAIALDGSVWVRANTYRMGGNALGGVDTYVITPEAVAEQ